VPSALHHIQGLVRAVGVMAGTQILFRRAFNIQRPIRVRYQLSGKSHSAIDLRPTESDPFVASQVFGWEEYRLPSGIVDKLNELAESWVAEGFVPVIVDAGANVGYSAIYLTTHYPLALVVAVEPDPITLEFSRKNTGQHERVKSVQGALWCDDSGVELRYARTGSWATSAVSARGNSKIPSFTITQLLQQVPNARVLILKLDIEGAERQVCDASHQVIRNTPCLIVEPHDFMHGGAGCLAPLYRALSGKEVDTLIQGENIVFVDSCLNGATG
jgi:FkbM family methyltransferase